MAATALPIKFQEARAATALFSRAATPRARVQLVQCGNQPAVHLVQLAHDGVRYTVREEVSGQVQVVIIDMANPADRRRHIVG